MNEVSALLAVITANPQLLPQLVGLSGVLSVIVEVLKKLPKVPVDSDNATVVILALATISVLTLAQLDGALTLNNADAIALVVAATFGLGVGLYKLVKPFVLVVKNFLQRKFPTWVR
jgi:hypothetical protein